MGNPAPTPLIRGWLFFTSTRNEVRFVGDKQDAYVEELPWEIFCNDDELFAKFAGDFSLTRDKSLSIGFCYEISLDYNEIVEWLHANCEVIDIEEIAD